MSTTGNDFTAPPGSPQVPRSMPNGAVLSYDVWGLHRPAMERDAATACGVPFTPGTIDGMAGRMRYASGIGEFFTLRFGWRVIYSPSFGKLVIVTDVDETRVAAMLTELGFASDLQICGGVPPVAEQPSLPLTEHKPAMLPSDGPVSFINCATLPCDMAEHMCTWHEASIAGRRPLCLLTDAGELDKLASHIGNSLRRTREIVEKVLAIVPDAVVMANPIQISIALPMFELECRHVLAQAGVADCEVTVEFESRFRGFSELPPSTPEGHTS